MSVTIGMDAGWGGLGWCLATAQGPIAAGHVVLDGTWQMARLASWLDGELGALLPEAELLRAPGDPPIRIVFEKPPMAFRGGAGRGGGPAGNQMAVGYGMGRLAGAIELWTVLRGLAYPWPVETAVWRGWWSIGGRGRAEKKRLAVDCVNKLGWSRFLLGHTWKGADGDGSIGDVAEGTLIAVGAARNIHQAPKGPARTVRIARRSTCGQHCS